MKVATRDTEIKLFGMNIASSKNTRVLPEKVADYEKSSGFDLDRCLRDEIVNEVVEEGKELEKDEDELHNDKDCLAGEVCESGNLNASSELDNNSDTTAMNEDSTTQEPSKDDKDENDDPKTLKKPDKIIPCPRCNSMDTKFCYYNNYNVNQPRHFCKRCQRYWTAGGTMRNVPVGAGRRKNKNSASNCHHIMVSEALQGGQIEGLNGYHHTNGTVLSFAIDESTPEKKNKTFGTQNGYKTGENGDDCSSGSSGTTTNSNGGQNRPQEPVIQNINGFPNQIPCLPGVPWPYMWNPSVPMPPMPFYPVPYWNYNVPGPWNMPWMSTQNPTGLDTNSQVLGKHSREGELLKPSTTQESSERSILVPKTLRIDDPEEAAKSSIWVTLGINYDSERKRGSVFNAFQPKYAEKEHEATAFPLTQANPAALSRSRSFQEAAT